MMRKSAMLVLAKVGRRFGYNGALLIFKNPKEANGSCASLVIHPDPDEELSLFELDRLQKASKGSLTIECMPRGKHQPDADRLHIHVESAILQSKGIAPGDMRHWISFFKSAIRRWRINPLYGISGGS